MVFISLMTLLSYNTEDKALYIIRMKLEEEEQDISVEVRGRQTALHVVLYPQIRHQSLCLVGR